MKRALSLLFVNLFFDCFAIAQQATVNQVAADFRTVNETYLQTPRLSMKVSYTLFPSYTSTAAFETDKGVYYKDGINSYSELLGIVSLTNSSLSMTLDSNEQTIVVTDAPSKAARNPSLVDLDSLLKVCSSMDSKDAGGGIRYYKLRFDGRAFFEYNAIDVYVNSTTHFLERIILYYRAEMDLDESDSNLAKDRPRLEIRYTDISTSPVFSAEQFSEKKFIRAAGKKITCAAAYNGYRLINHKLQ